MWLAVLTVAASFTGPAAAQDRAPDEAAEAALVRGLAAASDADFEGARAALEVAEAGPLTRARRVALYGHRALVSFALGDEEAAEADLARLLALGADASLPESAPPQLWERLERLRREGVRPPTVSTDARIEDGRARITADAMGGADLTRAVRIWVRTDDDWIARAGAVDRPLPPGTALRFYVEVLGPDAIRLAADGSRATPHLLRTDPALAQPETGGDDAVWWAVLGGGGAAVAVAVAVGLGVALSGGDQTQLSGPTLEL